MAAFKRVFLFVIVNMLVITTISILVGITGAGNYLTASGLDYGKLFVFCLIWGMTGSVISLAISRMMAKFSMHVQVIDPSTRDPQLREFVHRVHRLANQGGLKVMPEVGIYESPDVNAFATGPTASRSLVAVSTALLNSMNEDEVDAVLAHEISHITNGDMVTMTLVQGVINAFVMFFARVLAFFIASVLTRRDDGESSAGGFLQTGITVALQIAFSILGLIVVSAFSRRREFRADAGAAKLVGRDNMISALRALQKTYPQAQRLPEEAPAFASFKISGRGKLLALFSTHPPLEKRIERLQKAVG